MCKNGIDIDNIKIKLIAIGYNGINVVEDIKNLNNKIDCFAVEMNGSDFLNQTLKNCIKIPINYLSTEIEPEKVKIAVNEKMKEILEVITHTDVVIFVTSLAEGIGAAAINIIAKAAKDFGIFTLCIMPTCYSFEGKERIKKANENLVKLNSIVDSIITFESNIIQLIANRLPIVDERFELGIHKNINLINCFNASDI